MAIERPRIGRFLSGLGLLLAGCGSGDPTDLSGDSVSTKRQALTSTPIPANPQASASTQNTSVIASRLDIHPPAGRAAASSASTSVSSASYTQAAQAFAVQYASRYGLLAGAPGLDFVSIERSLKGVHVKLQERLGGIPVADSTFTVSFDRDTGQIYRVHSAVFSHQGVSASAARIDEDTAYDVAWNHLGVTGELTALPGAVLTYIPDTAGTGRLQLVYRLRLPVSDPPGSWQVDVDATSGAVLAVADSMFSRRKKPAAPPSFGAPSGPLADRAAAFAAAFASEEAKAAAEVSAEATVDGTGVVFDPDPATTLQDTTLADASPASRFNDAYRTVTLREITLNNGVYRLDGPWARIVDWDPPNTAPSTTTTGSWTARRGNNAFNDAMSYHHVDRFQRYMQSLGFTGASAIWGGAPVEIDSDCCGGEDNSYSDGPDNQIKFGHGGVDDNEDADVILHEYSHAVNYWINNNWTVFAGGDMGAMGEGFGDYWSASSNIDSFPVGFDNAFVYNWDANHNDEFWPGRRVDRTDLIYDPDLSPYFAHGIGDELWSTPLFQALLALHELGIPKTQVDTIFLEAQFGLGSNITMPQMATAIVDTANRLYPIGPHAGILSTKFFDQNMVAAPDWTAVATLVVVIAQR